MALKVELAFEALAAGETLVRAQVGMHVVDVLPQIVRAVSHLQEVSIVASNGAGLLSREFLTVLAVLVSACEGFGQGRCARIRLGRLLARTVSSPAPSLALRERGRVGSRVIGGGGCRGSRGRIRSYSNVPAMARVIHGGRAPSIMLQLPVPDARRPVSDIPTGQVVARGNRARGRVQSPTV